MKRLEKACKIVEELQVDALILDNPSDVFYLTGLHSSAPRLLLEPDGAKLIVDGRYFEAAKSLGRCEVVLAEKNVLQHLLKSKKKIGYDSSFTTVDLANALQKANPAKEWIAVTRPLKQLRAIKDASEIAILKKAAKVTEDGYNHILKKLKEGVQEQEIALEFEVYARQNGADGISFEPIIAFGETSAFPHYRAAKRKLQKNQIVLCDLGAVVGHYAGDMTRVFFFGDVDPQLKRFAVLVKEAHDLARDAAKPGIKFGELDRVVKEFFAKEGVEKLFSHSLGHGVGVDVHEYPRISADGDDRNVKIEPSMVFTIEPGLYLPGVGGIRYENTFVSTQNGVESFYHD